MRFNIGIQPSEQTSLFVPVEATVVFVIAEPNFSFIGSNNACLVEAGASSPEGGHPCDGNL